MENRFNFDFALGKFKEIIKNPDEENWYDAFYNNLPEYKINTLNRVAYFLAQTAHESMDFAALRENMNYSAEGLNKVFPNRFPSVKSALCLHRNPEKIANNIYANRMGNGAEITGDGWKFIGRGLIHVTGRSNYKDCSLFIFGDDRLLEQPQLLEERNNAVLSACWFWEKHKLNSLCDINDIEAMTRKINGGLNGIDDRKIRYSRYVKGLK